MAGEGLRKLTVLPPRSTGDKILLRHTLDVPYQNRVGTILVGQRITFAASGLVGDVVFNQPIGATTGLVSVLVDDAAIEFDPVIGETLTFNGGSATATVVAGSSAVYANASVTVSGDNPYRRQKIDEFGAAFVRYSEGPLELDAFGRARVGQARILCAHGFQYDGDTYNFQDRSASGGTAAHEAVTGSILLTTGTPSGQLGAYASHTYHKYFPGQSQFIELAFQIGDAGKANVRRRWGYFDTTNGVFFELAGTTMKVVVRSDASGSVVDTAVAQSAWNRDRFDGTGGSDNLSGELLDLTKVQLFWIDLQWPIGRVRFGIFVDGKRITLHEYETANLTTAQIMRTGALPVRWEQENTGVAPSTSQFRMFSARVWTEGDFTKFGRTRRAFHEGVAAGASAAYLFALRPKLLLNGRVNRVAAELLHLQLAAFDGTVATQPSRIVVGIYADPTLTGSPTWAAAPADAAMEADIAASGFTGGTLILETPAFGRDELALQELSDYVSGTIVRLLNDGVGQPTYVYTARTVVSGETADVMGRLTWREIMD